MKKSSKEKKEEMKEKRIKKQDSENQQVGSKSSKLKIVPRIKIARQSWRA